MHTSISQKQKFVDFGKYDAMMSIGGDTMKLIDRETYLNRLISLKGTPDIKVITGIRRCGKSKLLEEFIEWIKAHESDSNIIYVDLSLLSYEALKEYHALNDYIEERYDRKKVNSKLRLNKITPATSG